MDIQNVLPIVINGSFVPNAPHELENPKKLQNLPVFHFLVILNFPNTNLQLLSDLARRYDSAGSLDFFELFLYLPMSEEHLPVCLSMENFHFCDFVIIGRKVFFQQFSHFFDGCSIAHGCVIYLI